MSDEAISKSEAQILIDERLEHHRKAHPFSEYQREIIDDMTDEKVKAQMTEQLAPINNTLAEIQSSQRSNMKAIGAMVVFATLFIAAVQVFTW